MHAGRASSVVLFSSFLRGSAEAKEIQDELHHYLFRRTFI